MILRLYYNTNTFYKNADMMNTRTKLEMFLSGFLLKRISRRKLLKLLGLYPSALLICLIVSPKEFLVHSMSYFHSCSKWICQCKSVICGLFLRFNWSSIHYFAGYWTGSSISFQVRFDQSCRNVYVFIVSVYVSCKHTHGCVYISKV